MKLYFASGFVYMQKYEWEMKLYEYGVRYRLFSYFDLFRVKPLKRFFYRLLEEQKYHFIIDSGAFSALTSGAAINVEEYGKFLLSIKDNPCIDTYVNLDVIPERNSSSSERFDIAAEKGWDNLKYLESVGLKPLHVYHHGESRKWLDKLIDNYEYFGISMSSTGAWKTQEGLAWLDNCWFKILDEKGTPLRKVHGFGVTSPEILGRYPWHSVDSSTWGMTSAYGSILFPVFTSDRLVVRRIATSPHSTYQRSKGQHYNTLSSKEKEEVRKWVESCGVKIEDLLNEDSKAFIRDRVNVKFFLVFGEELEKRYKGITSQPGFFE